MTFAGNFFPADAIRATAVILLASLAGCAATPAPQSMPCPIVMPIKDASYLTRFAGASEDLTDTSFEAKVDAVHSFCHYIDDDTSRSIRSTLRTQFLASRGPKNPDGMAKFKYFVEYTGSGGTLVHREEFDTEIPLTLDKPQDISQDEIEVTIPIKQGENGDYYRIYIGLVLTEQEVAFNRRNPQQ